MNYRYLYVVYSSKSIDFNKVNESFQLCIDKDLKNVNQNMILFYSISRMNCVLAAINSMNSNGFFQTDILLKYVEG